MRASLEHDAQVEYQRQAAVDGAPVADAEVGRSFVEIHRSVKRADLRSGISDAIYRIAPTRRLALERELVPVEHRARADAEIAGKRVPVAQQRSRLELQLHVILNIVLGARLGAVIAVDIEARAGALAESVRKLDPPAERAGTNTERGVRRSNGREGQKRQYGGGDK